MCIFLENDDIFVRKRYIFSGVKGHIMEKGHFWYQNAFFRGKIYFFWKKLLFVEKSNQATYGNRNLRVQPIRHIQDINNT